MAAASSGIRSMNRTKAGGGGERRSLPKPEIRKSDRPNTRRSRVFAPLSISLHLYEGRRRGLGRRCTVELITENYPLRKHFAALIAPLSPAGGRGRRSHSHLFTGSASDGKHVRLEVIRSKNTTAGCSRRLNSDHFNKPQRCSFTGFTGFTGLVRLRGNVFLGLLVLKHLIFILYIIVYNI